MYRNGRPEDQQFDPGEMLYARFEKVDIDTENKIKIARIRSPDQSVNREKYSTRHDVLLPDSDPETMEWIYWGVYEFPVSAIIGPVTVPADKQIRFDRIVKFSLEHDPEEDNYAHCELRVYINDVRETDKDKVPNRARKQFREEIRRLSQVVIDARI